MLVDFVLIPGPPVRATSWQPTADRLRSLAASVQVPDVLADLASVPSWKLWTQHLLDHVEQRGNMVVVGHSSACALAAEISTRLPVRAVILVDGDIPPPQGAAAPVRPALLDFIRGLADAQGVLPPWSRWFEGDPGRASLIGVDALRRDASAFASFEQGLPRLTRAWFDDVLELARWDHIPTAYIQASKIYEHATQEAVRRGWPVMNLDGTHLDPALRPIEVCDAILTLTRKLIL